MHTPCLCEETHQRMFLHVDFLLFVAVDIHLHTTIYKECAEEQQHPVEATDDGSTEEDENETENDGTEDAPVEHMLVFVFPHTEGREYHHHHKKVVNREGLLNQIARDV